MTQAEVKYAKTSSADETISATTNDILYIAKGTTIAVAPGTGYSGVLQVASDDAKTGTAYTGGAVNADMFLRAAYTVNLGEGLNSADVTSGSMVVAGKAIALTVDASKGAAADVGVFNSTGKAYATTVEADLTDVTINGAKNFVVGTKITVGANGRLALYNTNTGVTENIVNGAATPAAAYVVEGTTVQAMGTAAANVATVQAGGQNVTAVGGTVNGSDQTVQFVVGTQTITVTFAT